MRYFVAILVVFITSLAATPQEGYLYLSNYKVELNDIDYRNYDAIQGKNNLMYFANKKGVISYDGVRWKKVVTPGTPYSLSMDKNGLIYVGCYNNFGFLITDPKGFDHYVSLSDSIKKNGFGEIAEVLVNDNLLLFYSSNDIFILTQQGFKLINHLKGSQYEGFKGCFLYKNVFYVNTGNNGLQKFQQNKLSKVSGLASLSSSYITTWDVFDSKQVILGTDKNKMFLFDGKTIESFSYRSSNYVEGNRLSKILSLDDKELAIATYSGGCLIIDKGTRQKKDIINYQSGLPDDEVSAICSDIHGGIWLCNEYAISRADVELPVHNYSAYLGLEGNIQTVTRQNGYLYVATNEGLYILIRVRNLDEVQNLIKKEHKQTTSTQVYRTIKTVTKLIKVTFNAKGINGEVEPVTKKIPITIEVPVDSFATTTQDVFTDKQVRKDYAMESIPFVYKKIKGIDGKCRQLFNFNNGVLVASNVGFYEVDTLKAVAIEKNISANFICKHPTKNIFYVATNQGVNVYSYQYGRWQRLQLLDAIKAEITSMAIDKKQLWLGSANKIIKGTIDKNGTLSSNFKEYAIKGNFSEDIIVTNTLSGLCFFSSTQVYIYNQAKDAIVNSPQHQKYLDINSTVLSLQPEYTWIKEKSRWLNLEKKQQEPESKIIYVELFPDIIDIFRDIDGNIWVVDKNQLYRVDRKSHLDSTGSFNLIVRAFLDKNKMNQPIGNITLAYNNNSITLQTSALYFLNESSTKYQYNLAGLNEEWSEWTNQAVINFPFLPSGSYTLQLRAKNVFGQTSNVQTVSFRVATPFWKTWWFYTLLGIIAAVLIYFFAIIRIRQLERAKRLLQHKIEIATREIRQQRDEIVTQRDEIKKKNDDITASITYAKRIQEAILPEKELITNPINDFFILYRPRDIVSGDFYWFVEEKDYSIIIAADCTGHGVPGAFMSMIGNTLLNQIIRERKMFDPGKILEELDKEIIKSLKQEKEDSKTKDGMDITLCTIFKDKPLMLFAGANNPIYYFSEGTENNLRGNKYGIGGKVPNLDVKTFTTYEIDISKPTSCYIFSDGYADQDGGAQGRKFMSGNLRKTLFEIHQKPFSEQKGFMDITLDDWIGDRHQRDDILLIGFKVGGNA